MSFILLEKGLHEPHGPKFRNRYKKHATFATLLIGTALLSVLLLSGFFNFREVLSIEPPGGLGALETSIAVRQEYPVSTFLYDRASFRWFTKWASLTVLTALAFYGLAGCVGVTGGLATSVCVAAAVGAAAAAVGLAKAVVPSGGGAPTTTADLELGNVAGISYTGPGKRHDDEIEYLNSIGGNGRREEAEDRYTLPIDLMRKVFGPDYKLHGYIPAESERHAKLVARNGGRPLRVNSFTSAAGTPFHHAVIRENGGLYHRFGFASPKSNTTISKRQTDGEIIEQADVYFTSGGIDVFDCPDQDSGTDFLTAGDAPDMQAQLECMVPDFGNSTQLYVEVDDATAGDAIGNGIIAPFNSTSDNPLSGVSQCGNGYPSPSAACGTQTNVNPSSSAGVVVRAPATPAPVLSLPTPLV